MSPTAIETSLTAARREDSQRRGLWRNETLEALLDRWAMAWPDRTAVVEIVSEFPMTPGGKIQKFRLRQLLAERLAGPRPDEESPWS